MRGRLLALAIGLALALLLGELLARLLLPPPPIVSVAPDAGLARRLAGERSAPRDIREREESEPGGEFMLATPTGLRLRAATSVVIENHWLSNRTIHLRTNAVGYRNPEIGPKSRRRVLFLGDSITLGEYVEEEETFVRLVERLSAERGEPLETINAGVNLIGLEEELAILVETGIQTEPDVVVVDMYLNDAFPSPGVWMVDVPAPLRRSRLLSHVAFALSRLRGERGPGRDMALLRQRWDAWSREIATRFPAGPGDVLRDVGAFNGVIRMAVSDWGSAWAEGAWERMTPVLREMKRQATLHGFELRIVLFPVRHQVDASFVHDFPQRRAAAVAREIDAPFLDLLPLFRRARDESREPLFYDNCHPTPYGNRLVAGWILDFLRRGG